MVPSRGRKSGGEHNGRSAEEATRQEEISRTRHEDYLRGVDKAMGIEDEEEVSVEEYLRQLAEVMGWERTANMSDETYLRLVDEAIRLGEDEGRQVFTRYGHERVRGGEEKRTKKDDKGDVSESRATAQITKVAKNGKKKRKKRKKTRRRVRKDTREMVTETSAGICKLKEIIGDRIIKCWREQIGRRQRYEEARDCVEENMVSIFPQQKTRREEAARGRKEERREKKQRMKRRKTLEEECKRAVRKNFVDGGVNKAVQELQNDYLEGTHQSNRDRERRWLKKKIQDIRKYYVWVVEEFNIRIEIRMKQKKEMNKIMASGAQRQQISWKILESLECKEKREDHKHKLGDDLHGCGEETGWRRGRGCRSKKQKKEGGKGVSEKADGQMWIFPQEVVEELTCRRERRRRLQLARWESPPPGPPGGVKEKTV